MAELTAKTAAILQRMFPASLHADVESLLIHECGNNLPLMDTRSPEELERVRFAVLKLSNGNLVELRKAIQVAQVDWRDTLMGAGFGLSVEEHERWASDYLKSP